MLQLIMFRSSKIHVSYGRTTIFSKPWLRNKKWWKGTCATTTADSSLVRVLKPQQTCKVRDIKMCILIYSHTLDSQQKSHRACIIKHSHFSSFVSYYKCSRYVNILNWNIFLFFPPFSKISTSLSSFVSYCKCLRYVNILNWNIFPFFSLFSKIST